MSHPFCFLGTPRDWSFTQRPLHGVIPSTAYNSGHWQKADNRRYKNQVAPRCEETHDIMNLLAQDQDPASYEITKSGEKVLKVKSFSTINQTLPICEYIMPMSHFARLNPDYDPENPNS